MAERGHSFEALVRLYQALSSTSSVDIVSDSDMSEGDGKRAGKHQAPPLQRTLYECLRIWIQVHTRNTTLASINDVEQHGRHAFFKKARWPVLFDTLFAFDARHGQSSYCFANPRYYRSRTGRIQKLPSTCRKNASGTEWKDCRKHPVHWRETREIILINCIAVLLKLAYIGDSSNLVSRAIQVLSILLREIDYSQVCGSHLPAVFKCAADLIRLRG